jgi:hypothetical protein
MKIGDEQTLFAEQKMLDLVIGYIVTGHVQKHQVYSRIITPGPFDRLNFGEEDSKGGIKTIENFDKPEYNTYKFLKNNLAKTFMDVIVVEHDLESLINQLIPIIEPLRDDSEIRLLFNVDNPLYMNDEVSSRFPNINFTINRIEDKEELIIEEEEELFYSEHGEEITSSNILQLLEAKLDSRNVKDKETILEYFKG